MAIYFKKTTYLYMFLGGLAGALIGILLFQGQVITGGSPARLCAFAMMVFLGIIAGRILAIRKASKKLNEVYRKLYTDGDPDAFITAFEPMLEAVPNDHAEYIDGACRMSFAYEAKGEFDQAKNMIKDLDPYALQLHALPSAALLANQTASLALLEGDIETAENELNGLKELKEAASKRAKSLASNIDQCIKLIDTRINALQGSEETDEAYLKEEIELSTNPIHKKEIQLELAKYLLKRERREEAVEILENITAGSKGLWSETQASSLLETDE